MTAPAISVLMAAHNAEGSVASSVDSILRQTFRDFEFLVIDDASIDRTGEILATCAAGDPRIVLTRNETNLGLTRCLNALLRCARGRYIARMDADDLARPERFARQAAFLDRHHGVFLVGSSYERVDERGTPRGIQAAICDAQALRETLPVRNAIYHPTILFRNDHGIEYREKFRYAQDYDLYLRLLTEGRVLANLPEPLLQYRVHAESVSFGKAAQQWLFAKKAREFHAQRAQSGADEYAAWDPAAILELDPRASDDPGILKIEIDAAFASKRFADARWFLQRYFRLNGVANRYAAHWLWSWFRQYAAPDFSATEFWRSVTGKRDLP